MTFISIARFEPKVYTVIRAEVSVKIFQTETRPRLERAETETTQETFETKRLQNVANIFNTKFWTFQFISEHVAIYQAMSYLIIFI